jgi:prepilin-type N-terminal cleavage/methylation domain-containing protein/prepilin-type processing-associated H-X9-DG protein
MCNPRLLKIRARAFTLIELLVVIGLIAILASILLPVLSTAHAQSDAMKCSANLRQLATGITAYAGEHDAHLPGPLEPLIYPPYTTNGEKAVALAKFIAPYISVTEKTMAGGKKTETVMTCPAFVRTVRDRELPSYVLNFADKLPDLNQAPWGDATGNAEAVQMSVLTAWRDTKTASSTYTPSPNGQKDLTRTWAIKDADVDAFHNMAGVGGTSGLPAKPVHGDYRNALFYDWHVARIDLEDNPR